MIAATLVVVMASAATAEEVQERYVVVLHASDGTQLSVVRAGSDNAIRFMSRTEALATIAMQNERHNNNVNDVPAVEARLYREQ